MKINNIYLTNSELINKFLEQEELFKDMEGVINTAATLNRELYINDIDGEMSNGVEAMIRFWNREDEQNNIPINERVPIKLLIDSCGGELIACYTIISAIELSKTPVWTINIGAAYSAGFLIYITGDKRFAYPLSSFLYHEGATSVGGDAHKFRNYADFYKKELNQLKTHVLKYTNITNEEYEKIFKDDYWLTAEEAKEKGMVDQILTEGVL